MSRENFRRLILLYLALVVADIAVALFVPTGYSEALSEALDNEPSPPLLDNLWLIGTVVVPFVAAACIGVVGLYLLKPWGRVLSLISTVVGLVLFPFFGPSVSSGLESSFYDATTLLWGAILALAYYSPVAIHFERPKQWSESTVES